MYTDIYTVHKSTCNCTSHFNDTAATYNMIIVKFEDWRVGRSYIVLVIVFVLKCNRTQKL